jgi:Mg2+-importing ATPase
MDAAELMVGLGTSSHGLSSREALERLQVQGPNAFVDHTELSALRLLLRQFESPLVLVLVFGAAISLFVRDWVDASIILAVVLGSTLLGFSQEFRASAAVAELRGRLALTVNAIREGLRRTVPAKRHRPG